MSFPDAAGRPVLAEAANGRSLESTGVQEAAAKKRKPPKEETAAPPGALTTDPLFLRQVVAWGIPGIATLAPGNAATLCDSPVRNISTDSGARRSPTGTN